MAPVQVYSASPITATKASGISPQTAAPDGAPKTAGVPATATATATSTASTTHGYRPAAAQPGATPSLPVQTGVPPPPQQQSSLSNLQPTPTSRVADVGPPAPQPGAAPVPPSSTAGLPPPPRAGEASQFSQPEPKKFYPPPEQSYYLLNGPRGEPVGQGDAFAHPPGYQQNASFQRSTHEDQFYPEDESVWNTAKKWATAAGNSLAEAENEVWRRVTKN